MSHPATIFTSQRDENPPVWVQGLPRNGPSSNMLPMRPQPMIPVLKIFIYERLGEYKVAPLLYHCYFTGLISKEIEK